MSTSGAHRRVSRPMLVVLQLLVFVTYIFGPTAALGEEPTPDPTPVETIAPDPAPEPTPEPTPSEEPATDEPSAPAPEEPSAPAEEPSAPVEPTIWTGKDDYVPTEWVDIYGSGWSAGEQVELFVDDHKDKTWSHTATEAADETGALVHEFRLPSWFVATYYRHGHWRLRPRRHHDVRGLRRAGQRCNELQQRQRCLLEAADPQRAGHRCRRGCDRAGRRQQGLPEQAHLPAFGLDINSEDLRGAISRPPFTCRRPSSARRPPSHSPRTGNLGPATARPARSRARALAPRAASSSTPASTRESRSARQWAPTGPSGGTKNAPGTGAAAVGDMVVRFIGNEKNETIGPAASPPRIYTVGSSNQHSARPPPSPLPTPPAPPQAPSLHLPQASGLHRPSCCGWRRRVPSSPSRQRLTPAR